MCNEEFEKVYLEHFNFVLYIAQGFTKNRLDAENIASDIFINLFKTDSTEIENIKSWLAICTKNASLNFMRKYKRIKYGIEPVEVSSEDIRPDEIMELAEIKAMYAKKLLNRVNELPEQCRNVFKMIFYEGMSSRQVSTHLGVALKTVANQKYLALKMLKSQLAISIFIFLLNYFMFK